MFHFNSSIGWMGVERAWAFEVGGLGFHSVQFSLFFPSQILTRHGIMDKALF